MVARNSHQHIFRIVAFLQVFHNFLNLVGSIQKISSAFLDDVQGNDVFTIEPCKTFLFFEAIVHLGNVAQFHQGAARRLNHNIPDGFNIGKLTFDPHRIAGAVAAQRTSRDRQVFVSNSPLNIAKGNLGRLHLENVGIDLYFTVERAYNVNTGNFLQTLNFILGNFSVMFQLVQIVIS